MKPLVYLLILLFFSAGVSLSAAQSEEPEATSLLGQPLYRMSLSPEQKTTLDANLAELVERLVQREIDRMSRRAEEKADP